MQIGPHALPSNLGLAPMAGVTDKPFRLLCKAMGAGLATSEMTTADPTLWHTAKSKHRMDHRGEPGIISVQIAGTEPDQMAQAARFNVDNGADIIDINMGCPAKKVCRAWAGSALMQDEKRVGQILEAVVGAVDVPVTLKIRTGWARDQKNAPTIARMAQACGIQALAIHGRTRDQKYQGVAEYDTIADIKANIDLPVWANGDIDSPEKARYVLDHTGADGLLIGRAAQGRPWVFQQISHFLATGEHLPDPSPERVCEILVGHLCALYDFYGEHRGVRVARKHLGWYAKDRPENRPFLAVVNQATDARGQLALTESYFASLMPPQRAVS
ncbi:MAG: tRNA dihydrouridine synthase DusB [Wenzhouxiangella sp.]|nr:tRNA dihydrouridine synthase DusB [Wenzhouxiangella sp.]